MRVSPKGRPWRWPMANHRFIWSVPAFEVVILYKTLEALVHYRGRVKWWKAGVRSNITI